MIPWRERRTPAAEMPLQDGSRVAIVGGGPAGSLTAVFLMRLAEAVGLELEIDLYEPRNFRLRGPAGCNHCGGVVSESLVQMLATEGVQLPDRVVQRGIDSYVLHLDVGTVRIDPPGREKRIAAVYRGNGPRDSEPDDDVSFDRHLLQLAQSKGTTVHRRVVTDLRRVDGRPVIRMSDHGERDCDLLVLATGVNSILVDSIARLGLQIRPAKLVKTFITEFRLGRKRVEEALGSSMHVFLLDLPRLEFAALIPKGDFVTCCLLGDGIDDELVASFLDAPEVRACFPDGVVPETCCHCFPRINVGPAWPPYADRVALVGDCGVTRLYKDGIGAAYRTAKAAATTAVLHGVSADAFRRQFHPVCRRLTRDNSIGRLLFAGGHVAQRLRPVRRAILGMTRREQASATSARRLSAILWDMFTGSAPYQEVLTRGLHPAFLSGLAWSVVAGKGPDHG